MFFLQNRLRRASTSSLQSPRPLPLKLPLSQPPELVLEAYPSSGLMSAVVRELDVVLGEGLLLVLRHNAIAV